MTEFMGRKTLTAMLLILGALLIYWMVLNSKPMSTLAKTRGDSVIFGPSKSVARTPSTTLTTLPSPQRQRLENERAELQRRLTEEQQALRNEQQRLQTLRQEREAREGVIRQGALTYPAQIEAREAEIQNLTMTLSQYRMAEEDLNQSVDTAVQEQAQATQANRTQLDQAIANLEAEIVKTKSAIVEWSNRFYDMTARAEQLTSLQERLTSQDQQLQQLKAQRANLETSTLQQTQAIHNTAQSQKSELIQNENAIQDQIIGLREEIRRLEQNQNQTQVSTSSMSREIQQAQQAIESQALRTRQTEQALREREDQLSQVR